MRRPEQRHIAAVRDSFWLLGHPNLFSQRFDARLACLTPRAEGAFVRLFPRGEERFVTALLRTFDALAADPEPEPGVDADSQVRALATRLLFAGMQRPDFTHVGSSLHRAARDSCTGTWNDELDHAWGAVCDWLVAGLQAATDGVEPPVSPVVVRPVADLDLVARLDRLAVPAG